MARIRTIKPEFYRHELLQELERDHPGQYPMLVFQALWGHCDRQGVFEWRPKQLALDILPFLWRGSIGEALGKTLIILAENGLVKRLFFEGREYGLIPSFADHQRLMGKEAQEPPRFPQLSDMSEVFGGGSLGEATGKQRGSSGEAVEKTGREGKGIGREEELKPQQQQRAGAREESAAGVFERCFDAHEADILRLFPLVDFAVEKALCAAHYRSRSPPVDPWPVVLKWLRRSRSESKGGQDGAGGQSRAGRATGLVAANGPDADWLGGSQFAGLAQPGGT